MQFMLSLSRQPNGSFQEVNHTGNYCAHPHDQTGTSPCILLSEGAIHTHRPHIKEVKLTKFCIQWSMLHYIKKIHLFRTLQDTNVNSQTKSSKDVRNQFTVHMVQCNIPKITGFYYTNDHTQRHDEQNNTPATHFPIYITIVQDHMP